jgi:Heparinase II/III-like protein/Heparinase II/III N-terminus
MSVRELAFRVRERFRRNVDRQRLRYGVGIGEDRELDALIVANGASLRSYLHDVVAPRFYPSTQDPDDVSQFIARRFPDWFDRAVSQADLLCRHRVNLLGYTDLDLGEHIDWHRDPVSGYEWARRFSGDYDLVNAPRADAKVIHEFNRHQHLPKLAKAFCLTANESYAREAISQMDSWIDQNPRWTGINWQSSLEIGIRSISWLWAIFLLLPSQALNEAALRRIVRSLFAQLEQICRYPSVYSSPNTHLIGEASALFIAGVLFQELPRASEWREFGSATLIKEMSRQVLPDGVYGELSSYYHCYAADFYLQVLALARWNHVLVPERVWTCLNQMLEFVMHITRPNGTIPLLGDDDGGRGLALGSDSYRSFRDGLSSGAVLFERGDFKVQSGGFCEETLWLLGADSWSMFNTIPSELPSDLSRVYRGAGYCIQRSGWDDKDAHVTFDCGGLGAPTGGHGHADALSLTLFAGGHEFLIDPGTFVYNCAPAWREYFRSTRAHNTVVVDSASQSEATGTFAWKERATTQLRQCFSLPEIDYVDGVQNGYARKGGSVIHRRRLLYIRPSYWIVLDDLHGNGIHDCDFLYHFAPETRLSILGDEKRGEIDCRAHIRDAGLQILLYASAALHVAVECGRQRPIQGWASEKYGERHPSPVLCASIREEPPVSMMSFLVPAKEFVESRRLGTTSSHATAVAIRDGDFDDVAVTIAIDGDLSMFDCKMRGEFFWIRRENGRICRLLAVNAFSFQYGDEIVFESKQPIPYVQAHFWDSGIVIEHCPENEGKVYVRDLRDRQFQRH